MYGVDDVLDPVARLFGLLLNLVAPGTGSHRRRTDARVEDDARPGERTSRRLGARPLRGEDHALARPYLVAHERREEVRRQRVRRRTLRLAVHGIDVGPRVIHGVEVIA